MMPADGRWDLTLHLSVKGSRIVHVNDILRSWSRKMAVVGLTLEQLNSALVLKNLKQ